MNAELPPLREVQLTFVAGAKTSLKFRFQEGQRTEEAMVEAMRRLIAATRPYLDDLPRA
ncbi:MAG: hypothetical protein IPP47_06955 [Bryobacterales bacterium]|nr:hypothetical protein [Bryobacterales bacterium]